MVNYDKLSFDLIIEVKKEYKNISKHKRILESVVYSNINVYINEQQIYRDRVFEEDVFYETLIKSGEYPLFNCACGIFECGGYNVEVIHHSDAIEWLLEPEYISDGVLKKEKFIFSKTNVISFADELIDKLKELSYDTSNFENITKKFKEDYYGSKI